MSAVTEILRELPLGQLAAQLGVDEETTQDAVTQTIPMLLSGMQANASSADGEQSLAGALLKHATSSLLDGGIDLGQIDLADGAKIVSHILGGDTDQTIARVSSAGVSSSLIRKLLPILAPVVLAWLGKNLQSGKSGNNAGDILGDILGRATGQQSQQQQGSGSILGSILGQMLGGGNHTSAEAPAVPSFPTQQSSDGELTIEEPQSNDSAQGSSAGGVLGGILKDILGGK
ncbi:MAG: DUF937 domain-containing protein [Propionibacteriaceae bacterium]